MKILLTGFDPFGGEPVNPAEEAVKRVRDNINGVEVIKITIPTVQTKSVEAIERAIELHNPDVVISVGQAGGRFDITPERVAINMDDFRIQIMKEINQRIRQYRKMEKLHISLIYQ